MGTLKTDPDEYFEKNLDNPRVLKHTSFLAMDDTGGASIEFCNQERTISGRDALAHLNRFHKYLESNWDKFEITPKLDHQQSSPEEKGTADYISDQSPSTSSQPAKKRTLGLKPFCIQQMLDQEDEDEKMTSHVKKTSPRSDAKMKDEERGVKSGECLGSVYDFDPEQVPDQINDLLSQGVRRSTRPTKRTPKFNATSYNFEHSDTSEDDGMAEFYAGGGASKAPKTYAGAVRRQTSSKKTTEDSSVAKVPCHTCPICHKDFPEDEIHAHANSCLND